MIPRRRPPSLATTGRLSVALAKLLIKFGNKNLIFDSTEQNGETNEGDRSASFLANLAVKMSAAGAGLAKLSTAARRHASPRTVSVPGEHPAATAARCSFPVSPARTASLNIREARRKLQAKQGGGGGGLREEQWRGDGSRNDFHAPNNEMRVSCHLCNRVIANRKRACQKRPRKSVPVVEGGRSSQEKAALGGDSRARATGSLFTSSSLSSGFVSLSDPSKRRRKSTGSGGRPSSGAGFSSQSRRNWTHFFRRSTSGGNKRADRLIHGSNN